jgi:hypothetical protein
MEQPSDLLKARTEAALLLRLDPSNLSPSDALRCDLIASLRLVVDDASATVLDGRAPDLARLLTATESLIRLLPSEPPKAESSHADPRTVMWETYLAMRRRGELADSYRSPQQRLEAARAKVAEIEAELAALAPPPDEPSAPGDDSKTSPNHPSNVVPLSRPPTERTSERSDVSPSPPAAPVPVFGNLVSDPSPEKDFRSYVEPDGSIRSTPRGRGQDWGPV